MKKFLGILLRILIFLTIVFVAYTFFSNSSNPFSKKNSSEEVKIEVYFKSEDSVLLNGRLTRESNVVSLTGSIKSRNNAKIKSLELVFRQFDKSDVQVGQETLLINREIQKNEKISFKKEGFTLDPKTDYLIIIPDVRQ